MGRIKRIQSDYGKSPSKEKQLFTKTAVFLLNISYARVVK